MIPSIFFNANIRTNKSVVFIDDAQMCVVVEVPELRFAAGQLRVSSVPIVVVVQTAVVDGRRNVRVLMLEKNCKIK